MTSSKRSPLSSPRHEATPIVTELELESAILRGVSNRRPVGRHKHLLIISLQADVHEETGVWVPIHKLWQQLRMMYDLEALDGMSSSTPSLPTSPEALSPIPNPKRRRPRADSASSLSASGLPSPHVGPSRSAAVINSEHFDDVFWLPGTVPPDRLRSGEPPTLSGAFDLPVTPTDDSGDEDDGADSIAGGARDFFDLLAERAVGADEGSDWEAGVKAQKAANDATPAGPAKPRRGRPTKSLNSGSTPGPAPAGSGAASGSRRTSGTGAAGEDDTSPLSSDAEAIAAPAQAPRKRGRPRGSSNKRTRESVETDEDERPTGRRRRR